MFCSGIVLGYTTSLRWLQECEDFSYDEMISCPEDVYERLVKEGCSEHAANAIAKKVLDKNRQLVLNDHITMTDYCVEICFHMCDNKIIVICAN